MDGTRGFDPTPAHDVNSGVEPLAKMEHDAQFEASTDERHPQDDSTASEDPGLDSKPQSSSTSSSRGWRFWAVLSAICLATLLVALEATVPTASLPTITSELSAGDNWVWIINGYLLANTVLIPFFGQSAFVFGRRWPMLVAVGLFIIGSGISGGATNISMLIGGRVVQGLGGAGISVLSNIIVSDLTTVRERGKYLGIVYGVLGLGLALGPPIGGVIAAADWRWVFWLNLPVGGLTLGVMFLFLHVDTPRPLTVAQGLRRVDWIGNALLIASVVSILIALSWADTRYPWSSWHILVPLLVGLAGMAGFHAYEASSHCANPTLPPRLFANRTAAVSFLVAFFVGIVTVWRLYFVTLYFEGVLRASSSRAGVLLLPTVLVYVPASVSGGFALSKWGRYKPLHLLGLAFIVLASGLYIDFDRDSSLAKIVLYQMVAGWGTGMLITTTLPAAQASLPATDLVPASALWAYLRVFGGVWGIAVPAAIFNSRFAVLSSSISDETVRKTLGGGNAYAHVSGTYVSSLPSPVRDEVIQVYSDALKVVWYTCLALSVVALAIAFLEREIPMRTTLDAPQREKSEKPAKDLESGVNRAPVEQE